MSWSKRLLMLLALGFGLCGSAWGTGAHDKQPIRFGSVAMDTPAVMQRRLKPLTEYLSKELGRPVILKLSPDMPAAIEAVSTGAVDLAYLTPVAYLRAHARGGSRLIVKTVTKNQAMFRLMIIVRSDSSISSVQQLAGKRFAFGDRAALLQRAVVVGAGMPLRRLGHYAFLGHYDNIVRGVLVRDFDAGIVKDTKAYQWQGKGIRVLYRSPELPPYNIAASRFVSHKLFLRLRSAFVRLDVSDPEHAAVIKALSNDYDGFVPGTDADYNVVRRLIRPFEKSRN